MAVFTELSIDEVTVFFRALGLATPRSVRGITGPAICALAEKYGAVVMVDDCQATGHLGEAGRGTPTLTGTSRQVDIVTGTLGKSLGGAMGSFVAASQPIVDLLRQRARPYLFSNNSRLILLPHHQ